jgi:hypothetical protein
MKDNKKRLQFVVFLGFFGISICLMGLVNLMFPGAMDAKGTAGKAAWFNTALMALGATFGIVSWWLYNKS